MTDPEGTQQKHFSLKPAEIADTAEITEVFISSRSRMDYLPNLHTPEETEKWIRSLLEEESNTVLKAMDNDRIAGFSVVGEGWIDHMYVSPGFQGRGIGSALIAEAQTQHSHLELVVFQQNTGAISLYERSGFVLAELRDGTQNEENIPDARYVWDCAA